MSTETLRADPGHSYYQQKADYKMSITLNDDKQIVRGEEVITYTNNSPDVLEYLWLQLDQNIYKTDAESNFIEVEKMEDFKSIKDVENKLFVYSTAVTISNR